MVTASYSIIPIAKSLVSLSEAPLCMLMLKTRDERHCRVGQCVQGRLPRLCVNIYLGSW